MKRSFFQAAVTSILLYGCTTWTLTKRLEKKLDGNYTRMLRAILNKSWQQHPTRHQLYGHLPPITKTIQVRRTRHAGHCWRSRDELIRDVLLWIPTHGRAKAGRPARTYIQQLCEDTGCCPEDLPRAMNDREEWRERVRDIRAASTIWWWWWYSISAYWRGIMKEWWTLLFYKNVSLSSILHKRVETGCRHVGKTGRRRTRTQTGRGVLYWPYLNPCWDSIFRALHPCFQDKKFSTGSTVGHCSCSFWAFFGRTLNLLTAQLTVWSWVPLYI